MTNSLSKTEFLVWPIVGQARSGRFIRDGGEWGLGVWWSERFNGVVSPIVDAVGGPLGYEKDPYDEKTESIFG